jgi:hypothetical protein
VGSFGDASIFCLYKSFGLPDGAALLSKPRLSLGQARQPWGYRGLMLRHGSWLASRFPLAASAVAQLRRARPYSSESIALGDPATPPTKATIALLARAADEALLSRRRENYLFLLEHLSDLAVAPFNLLPAGAIPHAFPLRHAQREELIRSLKAAGIHAFSFWAEPHPALAGEPAPETARRRATTIVLPVHQHLRPRDLETMVAAVRRSPGISR